MIRLSTFSFLTLLSVCGCVRSNTKIAADDFCDVAQNPKKYDLQTVKINAIAFPDHTYDINLMSASCPNTLIMLCLPEKIRSEKRLESLIDLVYKDYPYETSLVDISIVGEFHDRAAPLQPMALCLTEIVRMTKRSP